MEKDLREAERSHSIESLHDFLSIISFHFFSFSFSFFFRGHVLTQLTNEIMSLHNQSICIALNAVLFYFFILNSEGFVELENHF